MIQFITVRLFAPLLPTLFRQPFPFPFHSFPHMNEELLELLSLRELGLTDAADEVRLQALLRAHSASQSPVDFQDVGDFLAEAMVSSSHPSEPSILLKERVMVATDPELARVVTDPQCAILSISPAFTDLCGYTLEEVKGRKPGSFLQGPETQPDAVEKFRAALRAQENCVVEIINYHKCGSSYRVRIEMQPVFSKNGSQLLGYSALETKLD